ncbi:MAG: hypothetical protein J0L52_00265 [Caulobacterales bacterium]|nr:hypothetical protein [Caulobacterales bacterium]
MELLSPAYMSTLAAQIGTMSAFLGGFSATFLGTLLALQAKGRLASWAIGCAATSSVAFIVAVVGSTGMMAGLHPDAPREVLPDLGGVQLAMGLAFAVGLYSLLISLGLSGWSRSRAVGLTTSILAGLGVLMVSGLLGVAG